MKHVQLLMKLNVTCVVIIDFESTDSGMTESVSSEVRCRGGNQQWNGNIGHIKTPCEGEIFSRFTLYTLDYPALKINSPETSNLWRIYCWISMHKLLSKFCARYYTQNICLYSSPAKIQQHKFIPKEINKFIEWL